MKNDYKELATETFKLHMKVKKEIEKLKEMKIELLKKLNDAKKNKYVLEQGYIRVAKWKTDFSNTLNKEFKKIDENKKKEFLQKGLLKLKKKLNTNEYQLIKNKNEKSDLDEFVIKRNNKAFLQFKINEKKESSKYEIGYSEDYQEYLEMDDEIIEELMQEIQPDPIYHEDDGDELTQHERDYKGYD